MIYFQSDYQAGGHPKVMERLMETNLENSPGYGEDAYCEGAAEAILRACDCQGGAVHFMAGGTQTNLTLIASALRPFEGVLCPDTGHINVHETGAIEATGHKVIALPNEDGKITAAQVDSAMTAQGDDEHMVRPGMVYISYPTELGTLYTREELCALRQVCNRFGLLLYVDGARLAYGLAAAADVTLPFLAEVCDAFYIGGTKCGALFGEALVLINPALQRDFRYHMKQRGGLMAKGRLLGVQFEALFAQGLYQAIGSAALEKAAAIRRALEEMGVPFLVDSPTNQLFPILAEDTVNRLREKYAFARWQPMAGGLVAIRLVTSYFTRDEEVESLIKDLRALL